MLLGIFAVYDTAVSTWHPPIYFRNKGEALRWWQEVCNNPESKIAKHPDDFTLFDVGTFDDDKCSFNLLKTPVSLGKAIEFIRKAAQDFGSTVERKLPEAIK